MTFLYRIEGYGRWLTAAFSMLGVVMTVAGTGSGVLQALFRLAALGLCVTMGWTLDSFVLMDMLISDRVTDNPILAERFRRTW